MKIKIGANSLKSFTVTEKAVVQFSNCTTDKNPIHLNEEYAKNSMFKSRIAHGMLIGGFISSVIGNDFPGIGTIYVSQTLNFKKPVFFGEVITVEVEVIDFTERDWLKLSTICKNQNKDIVLDGTAVVIPPRSFQLVK